MQLYDNVQIISLDGNIGSGKTTLMKYLIKNKTYFESKSPETEFLFLLEPVDSWNEIRDEHNVPILTKFYEDQERYGFSFQMMAYLSRLSLLKKTIEDFLKRKQENNSKEKLIIITERSLLTDRDVFCKMLYDTKKICSLDYNVYNKMVDMFSDDYPVNKIIYLLTKPEVCAERTVKRAREGENKISSEYLWLCDIYHKYMVDIFEKNNGKQKILELEDNNEELSLLEKILSFIL